MGHPSGTSWILELVSYLFNVGQGIKGALNDVMLKLCLINEGMQITSKNTLMVKVGILKLSVI